MTTPDAVLRCWQMRYGSLPEDQKESFLSRPSLRLLEFVDDDIVSDAIDYAPKIDEFVKQALATQVHRLRNADVTAQAEKGSTLDSADPAEVVLADDSASLGPQIVAPGAVPVAAEDEPPQPSPGPRHAEWTESEIGVVIEKSRRSYSLGSIAQDVNKSADDVERLLSIVRFGQSAPSTKVPPVPPPADPTQAQTAQRDRPPAAPPSPSAAIPPASLRPKTDERVPAKKSKPTKTKKPQTNGAVGGFAHKASGYSGKPRSTPAEFDNREQCSSCEAWIDPASASLHQCWG